MRLESLKIKGLGAFRNEVAIDFSALGDGTKLVAIVGENGAGKTTFVECFPGALFRKTPTRGTLAQLATERGAYLEARVVNGQSWTIRHVVDPVSSKGESVVTDVNGRPVLASAKVREFDQWSAEHLPAPEVFFSTMFAAQKSEGFLGLAPAARKAVLLRVLGVEQMELLSSNAREQERAARASRETLAARLDDERARGGDPVALAEALAVVKTAQANDLASLEQARKALADAETEAKRVRELRAQDAVTRQRRTELEQALKRAQEQHDDIAERIANNEKRLGNEANIRAAVAAVEQHRAAIEAVQAELEAAQLAHQEAFALSRERGEAVRDAAEQARSALRVLTAAERSVQNSSEVRDLAAQLVTRRVELEAAEQELKRATQLLSALQVAQLAGAEDRIKHLRGGLQRVTEPARSHTLAVVQTIAKETLASDSGMARAADEHPAKLQRARDAELHARSDFERASARFQEAKNATQLLPQLDEAEQAVTIARDELERANQTEAALRAEWAPLLEDNEHKRDAVTSVNQRLQHLRAQLSAAEPVAAQLTTLEQCKARLESYAPQMAHLTAELARIREQLGALPVPAELPPEPVLPPLDRAVRAIEEAVRKGEAAVAVAEQKLAAAQESADRLRELEQQLAAADAELSDWTRLAADLGKDGLQALEIDAAGPELTELVNDLLHTCHGPRWTVRVDTQKLASDGKRMLEGCEVSVVDTVAGREGAGETFSGGEAVIIGEALSLALTMLACRRSGVAGPTLVRDESGAALSPENARVYVAMLRRAAEIVGASRVLVISHTPEVWDMCDARINVKAGRVEVAS
jgi:exonuclease SbcC